MLEGSVDHLNQGRVPSESSREPLRHRGTEFDGGHMSASSEEIDGRLPGTGTDLAHLRTRRHEGEQVVEQRRRVTVASPLVAIHGPVDPAAIVKVAALRHHPSLTPRPTSYRSTCRRAFIDGGPQRTS